MYTLLQFSLLVFTISTKILFLPYLYVVVGQVPVPFDLWHYCMQAFAKKVWPCEGRWWCEKATMCDVVYACKDVRDYVPHGFS